MDGVTFPRIDDELVLDPEPPQLPPSPASRVPVSRSSSRNRPYGTRSPHTMTPSPTGRSVTTTATSRPQASGR
ncbi:hypothetical protein ACIBI9_39395 [Nonomuraea sp. NPDC050451]|uniref:hypothetical protein n=1 Tax=Nonomuraea sp. NPDC050451 TaxID=3364364 RepID=UPI0037B0C9D9